MPTSDEFREELEKLGPEKVRMNIAGLIYLGWQKEYALGWLDNFTRREQSQTARSANNAAWIAAIAAIIAAICAIIAIGPTLHWGAMPLNVPSRFASVVGQFKLQIPRNDQRHADTPGADKCRPDLIRHDIGKYAGHGAKKHSPDDLTLHLSALLLRLRLAPLPSHALKRLWGCVYGRFYCGHETPVCFFFGVLIWVLCHE